jgi:hypothetical protein
MKLKFSWQIFDKKNTQIPNLNKIRPMGAELFHEDRRTDMMKNKNRFRSFAKAPKNDLPPLTFGNAERERNINFSRFFFLGGVNKNTLTKY